MLATLVFYGFAFWLLVGGAAVVFSRNAVHGVLWLIFTFFNAAGLFLLLGAEFLSMMLVIVYVGAVAVLFLFVVMMLDVTPSTSQGPTLKEKFSSFIKATTAFLPVGVPYALITAGLWTPMIWFTDWPTPALMAALAASALGAYALTVHLTKKSPVALFLTWLQSLPLSLLLGLLMALEIVVLISGWQALQATPRITQIPFEALPASTNTHAIGQVLYTHYASLFQMAGIILLIAMVGAIALTHRKSPKTKRQDVRTQVSRHKGDALRKTKPPLGQGIPR